MIKALVFLLSATSISVIFAQNNFEWNGNGGSVNNYQDQNNNIQCEEKLETKIKKELWTILISNTYPNNNQKADAVFSFIERRGYMKELCRNSNNQYYGILHSNIKSYIDEFNNIPRNDVRQIPIKDQLAQRFPKLSQKFRNQLKTSNENLLNVSWKILMSNKQEFLNFLNYIALNVQGTVAAIEEEIDTILEQEFQTFNTNDEFENFKNQCTVNDHYKYYNYGILFDDQSLNETVKHCKKIYDRERVNQAYHKIVKTLNSLYPNSHDGNRKFAEFLWNTRVDLLQLTLDMNNFSKEINFHMKQYEKQNKLEFDRWTASKFTRRVESNPTFNQPEFHPTTPERKANDEFVRFSSTLRPHQTSLSHFTTQSLTTQKTVNLDDVFNQCLNEVYKDVENLDNGIFVKEDNCLLARICKTNSMLINDSLAALVDNYYENNRHKNENKILDEVDETIYEVISEVLTTENLKLEKVEAYIFFLKKISFINSTYNPELLFDTEELLKLLRNQHFKCFFGNR